MHVNPSSTDPGTLDLSALTYDELASGQNCDWVWHGYLAQGNTTLLTGVAKSTGKTTLLSVLLDQLREGGMLGGRAVRAGKAVVLSEESRTLWFNRGRKFKYSGYIWWFCRPFNGKPTPERFHAFLDDLRALHERHGFNVLIIDTLASFLPTGSENSADAIIAFLSELQVLTQLGIAVLALHHPGKKPAAAGQAARGSSALIGHVDIIIEMRRLGGGTGGNRRRRLRAWSRHDETPERIVIELNEAGTDYTVVNVPDDAGPKQESLPSALDYILRHATLRMTREQILNQWPRDERPPSDARLWRMLKRACAARLIAFDGTGHRDEPFRYYLPEREQECLADPLLRSLIESNENWRRKEREKSRARAAASNNSTSQP